MDVFSDMFAKVKKDYWNYYIELEKEVLHLRKYIDFNTKNYNTFSIEILKLYQAICSEIDVVGKSLAKFINPNYSPKNDINIYKWWFEIENKLYVTNRFPSFINDPEKNNHIYEFEIYNHLFDCKYKPWFNFYIIIKKTKDEKNILVLDNNKSTPKWWSDYNKVKHNRINGLNGDNNYEKANLYNLINALTALYILESSYLQNVGNIDDLEMFINESVMYGEPYRPATTNEMNNMLKEVFGDK